MKQQKNLRDRYIQLVETFITAIESGRSGAELEDIRKEIRVLSATLNSEHSVENHPHINKILPLIQQQNESMTAVDISFVETKTATKTNYDNNSGKETLAGRTNDHTNRGTARAE